MFGPGCPYLLAINNIIVAVPDRRGANAAGVGAAGRFGNAERLQTQFATGDVRQDFFFLGVRSMSEHGAHDVHLGMTGAGVAARMMDFAQDRGGFGNAKPAAAKFLGDQNGQVPGIA